MPWLAAAGLGALLLYLALRWFANARTGELALAARTFVAVFSALASTGLIFAGRFGLAVVTIGAMVMALRSLVTARRGADPLHADEARGAKVQTRYLAMELDRRTGRADGAVREGRFRNSRLRDLGVDQLRDLLTELQEQDPPSVDLLEAYLDRRHPDWRRDRAGTRQPGPPPTGGLDEATALQVLGLEAGATPEEIKAAHRRLMARYHPDHGGSTYLASQINQAKALLLGRQQAG